MYNEVWIGGWDFGGVKCVCLFEVGYGFGYFYDGELVGVCDIWLFEEWYVGVLFFGVVRYDVLVDVYFVVIGVWERVGDLGVLDVGLCEDLVSLVVRS